jgi:hypothetical protein
MLASGDAGRETLTLDMDGRFASLDRPWPGHVFLVPDGEPGLAKSKFSAPRVDLSRMLADVRFLTAGMVFIAGVTQCAATVAEAFLTF